MLDYLSSLYYILEKVNFLGFFIAELLGIAAFFILRSPKKKLPREWCYLLLVILLMIFWRGCVFGDKTWRRYYVPLALPFVCWIPWLFEILRLRIKNKHLKVFLFIVLCAVLITIPVLKNNRPHPVKPKVLEAIKIMNEAMKLNPPDVLPVEFYGNTTRENQMKFFSQLPLDVRWVPEKDQPQYLRGYHFKFRKDLPDTVDVFLLLEDQSETEIQLTLDCLKQEHQFKLVYEVKHPMFNFYHLKRNLTKTQETVPEI